MPQPSRHPNISSFPYPAKHQATCFTKQQSRPKHPTPTSSSVSALTAACKPSRQPTRLASAVPRTASYHQNGCVKPRRQIPARCRSVPLYHGPTRSRFLPTIFIYAGLSGGLRVYRDTHLLRTRVLIWPAAFAPSAIPIRPPWLCLVSHPEGEHKCCLSPPIPREEAMLTDTTVTSSTGQ
jgi:hypothetical protein